MNINGYNIIKLCGMIQIMNRENGKCSSRRTKVVLKIRRNRKATEPKGINSELFKYKEARQNLQL